MYLVKNRLEASAKHAPPSFHTKKPAGRHPIPDKKRQCMHGSQQISQDIRKRIEKRPKMRKKLRESFS